MKDMKSWLDQNLPELIAIRHQIHSHPELGFEEFKTSKLVAEKLRSWGIETVEGIGKTGVVGVIKGDRPGQRAIGLRADLDALAIHEKTGVPYASQIEGKMHACGHDGHTTMLLGAARYLSERRDFAGTLNLIFQPAEEGRRGAIAMIEDGLFERFPCDAIYGLHNTPGMPEANFGTRVGPMMAAADTFQVTFKGTGGHGGVAPHRALDVTYAQAQFILGLQGIVGRNVAPLDTATISVGYIHGGSSDAANVIPSELVLGGTTRSYSEQVRELLERRIVELARLTAESWGCSAEAVYDRGPSAVTNHAEQVDVVLAALGAFADADRVNSQHPLSTGGEDFADMMRVKPGAFTRIGSGVAASALHTPTYDFNDAILPDGIRFWVAITEQELGHAR